MKSDVCLLSTDKNSLQALLNETEKAASYSNLRLLAEELVSMLPELLDYSNGSFWIESEEKKFELHVSLSPNESLTAEKREKLLKVSTSGKNSAATGIMSKIKIAAQFMLIDYEENAVLNPSFYDYGLHDNTAFSSIAWSLNVYREKIDQEKKEDWDELEKSIVANIADDVCVGLQGKKVDIIVKKSF